MCLFPNIAQSHVILDGDKWRMKDNNDADDYGDEDNDLKVSQ